MSSSLEWPVKLREPQGRGSYWHASVSVTDEDNVFGYEFWALGTDAHQAVEILKRQMVAFFQEVEEAGTVALLIGDPGFAVRRGVYPPSLIAHARDGDLIRKLQGLLTADFVAETARLEGRAFENPINVELTEHEIALGFEALGAAGQRKLLARLARLMLDEPSLEAGAGLTDVVKFIGWLEDRFGIRH